MSWFPMTLQADLARRQTRFGAHTPALPYVDDLQQLTELSLTTPEAIITQAAILPDLLLAYRKHIRL